MANGVQLDEITLARKNARRKQRRLRRLRAAAAVAAVLLLIYAFIAAFSSTVAYDISDTLKFAFSIGSYPYETSEGSYLDCGTGRKCVAMLSDRRLTVLKAGGAELMSVSHGMANPCLAVRGNRILLYSSGGKSYQVFNRTHRIGSSVSAYSIISADVSAKGKILLLTAAEEYTCELKVLEKDCEPRFSWYGTDGFPLSVTASQSGERAAVVCLKAEGGKMLSVITVLDLRGEKEIGSFTAEGVAAGVSLSGDRVLCVFENRAEVFDIDGTSGGSYSFGDLGLIDISFNGSGAAIALGDNTRSQINRVVLLSSKLAETAVIETGSSIDGLYLNSDRLGILSGTDLYSYTSSGSYRGIYHAGAGVSAVVDVGGPIAVGPDRINKLTMAKGE